MGFRPSLQLEFFADGMVGGDGAPLNTSSISLSNLDPRLWVLLRLRNCANFANKNVKIGPREGRHGSVQNYIPSSV